MIIRAKKGKFPLICIIGIPLFSLSLFVIRDVVRSFSDSIYNTIIYAVPFVGLSYLALTLSLAGFVDFIRTRVSRNATLTITDSGINDHLSIYSAGNVLWTEIT